jgi:hypothetical protein
MSQKSDYQKDIESIRQLMERSVKFLSLSGLSGILSGIYALVGATLAYTILYNPKTPFDYANRSAKEIKLTIQLVAIATIVLSVSLITGYLLASKKAKKLGVKIWDSTSKRLLINLVIPLISGGAFIMILLATGQFILAVPACLIFYGLALINASPNLFDEFRYLGYCEIALGLACAVVPGYGLVFWSIGFGVLHIIYGTLMLKKYDR